MSRMASLELKNIVKRFKDQTVLDDLSLERRRRRDDRALRPFRHRQDGAAAADRRRRSTPTTGQILIGGEDMTDVDAEYRGIGMAFQNFALFPHMTRLRQHRDARCEAQRASAQARSRPASRASPSS